MSKATKIVEMLLARLREQPIVDRRGEAHIRCPECLRDPNLYKPNFSFSERGGHCFSCGCNVSVQGLPGVFSKMDWLLSEEEAEAMDRPSVQYKAREKREVVWHEQPEKYLERYVLHRDRVKLWQSYKPLSEQTIRRFKLGVGVMPYVLDEQGNKLFPGGCRHRRLIYPVGDYKTKTLLGFRGRVFECDCKAKWVNTFGLKPTLWGLWFVRPGSCVVGVENPVDAMLAMQHCEDDGNVFVAPTHGANSWEPEWPAAIVEAGATSYVSAYDNDLAGSPNYQTYLRLVAEWQVRQRARLDADDRTRGKPLPRAPMPHGWKVVETFKGLPVDAAPFSWPDWAPPKADWGWLITEGSRHA